VPEPGELSLNIMDLIAIQLTLLRADGSGKVTNEQGISKISVGPCLGTPIVLAPANEGLGLAICEGVEDALSAHESTGLGVWASTGAKKLAALAPSVPQHIESVSIFADDDTDGRAGANELALTLHNHGCEVRLILPEKRVAA
jgi:hypothetical protein